VTSPGSLELRLLAELPPLNRAGGLVPARCRAGARDWWIRPDPDLTVVLTLLILGLFGGVLAESCRDRSALCGNAGD
jgi:hypothetical protein